MASSYISALPHVRYTAVGINFHAILVCEQAAALIIDKFLKPGTWHCEGNKPRALELKLVYPLHWTSLHFKFGAGPVSREKISGILVNANFHSKVSGLKEAKATIYTFGTRYKESYRRILNVFKEEA